MQPIKNICNKLQNTIKININTYKNKYKYT